jgi:hypothetical protein
MARNAGIPINPFKGSSALTSDAVAQFDAAKLTAVVDNTVTVQIANAASPTETDWETVASGTTAFDIPTGFLWFRCLRSIATTSAYIHKQIR